MLRLKTKRCKTQQQGHFCHRLSYEKLLIFMTLFSCEIDLFISIKLLYWYGEIA
jgi:hypothetical protein